LYWVSPGRVSWSSRKLPGGRPAEPPWPGRYLATRAARGYGDACL